MRGHLSVREDINTAETNVAPFLKYLQVACLKTMTAL